MLPLLLFMSESANVSADGLKIPHSAKAFSKEDEQFSRWRVFDAERAAKLKLTRLKHCRCVNMSLCNQGGVERLILLEIVGKLRRFSR